MNIKTARLLLAFTRSAAQSRMTVLIALTYLAQHRPWVYSADITRLTLGLPLDEPITEHVANTKRSMDWFIAQGVAERRKTGKRVEYRLTKGGMTLGQSLGCVYK